MNSYWLETMENKKCYETLKKDLSTEVCIIGGGLTGLSTAYYLSKAGIDVVVLEKNKLSERTSGNSTAKITSQHGLFYKYLIDSEGKEFAKEYYNSNEEAIKKIKEIIEKENIECDLEEQDSYVFTQKLDDVQKIKDELEALKQIGADAKIVEKTELPMNILIALKFPKQAQFNPCKYSNALANCITKNNGKIYENSKVVEVKKDNEEYIVNLDNGVQVRAKFVVIATKYPIVNTPGYYFLKMYQSTSYAIAVDAKDPLFEGMYINSEEPTLSFRTIKDGKKRLLLIVGFDHKTGAKINLENSYGLLEDVAKKLYPECEIKYRWNTEDCITLDKIPYIGEFSKFWPNVYVGTGYKKWGITTSNIAANIISDKILGKENKYEEIYKATRVEPVKNIKEVENMLKETTHSLILNKLKIPKEKIEEVKPEEGKIVEIEGKKVGVYKNKEGKIFAIKPVCTHLGCELSWNNLDKTWDCPCHGSRFKYNGENIYGPSVKNLEKYEI